MLYIVENTVYCMQINHARGTLGTSLRYGIAKDSLRTIKIYDYKYSSSAKKVYKYIKSYKTIENLQKTTEQKDNTCEVRVKHEGKPRGDMGKKPDKEVNIINIYNNTIERGKLKYVHIIPHE